LEHDDGDYEKHRHEQRHQQTEVLTADGFQIRGQQAEGEQIPNLSMCISKSSDAKRLSRE
jgi:hypothetical protein